MKNKKFYWEVKKDSSSHDLNLFATFQGKLFKKGSAKTDIWESKGLDDSLETVFGEPINVKYETDEEIDYLKNRLRIDKYKFAEVDGKWDVLYICLNEANEEIKILQSLL